MKDVGYINGGRRRSRTGDTPLCCTGAAAVYAVQGNYKEVTISLVGDAATLATGGANKLYQAGKVSAGAVRNVSRAATGVEAGLGIYRTAEGTYLLSQGEGGTGEIAEGLLRLFGVSVKLVGKSVGKGSPRAGEAPRGVDWLADAMKGWKSGEVVPESVLKRLSSRLNRNNVSVIQNEWALEILKKSGDGAQFVRFKDGSAGLLLRPNATRYQIVHEAKHYEHWLADPKKYGTLSKLEREEFVYKALQEAITGDCLATPRKLTLLNTLNTSAGYTAIRQSGTGMTTTTTITNVCQIAENYGREIGLAEFQIERVVHSRKDGKDEWIIHVRFGELDPLIEDDGHSAIIVVDAVTEKPRLIEGL
ncbi:MAG: zincin-like metallopeptidase toxin domain-containing protein [Aureliella sp.]